MRVFIGLTEIAGYYANLVNGLNELNIECTFVDLGKNKFQYKQEVNSPFINLILKINKKKEKAKLAKPVYDVFSVISRIALFIYCLFLYDTFIFGFSTAFFRFYDLPILKFFNKKIIYIFHGSDSRPPYLDGTLINNDISTQTLFKLTLARKKTLKVIEKYADAMIDSPPQCHLHEKRIISSSNIGIPFEFNRKLNNEATKNNTDNIIILHSPSNPMAKGTEKIRGCINNLKEKGYKIEFIELINQPNSVVIENIMKCDFIIDQVYSDFPLPGLATEAAYFGKPTVIAGYYAPFVKDDIAAENIPPSLFCLPDELETSVEKLIIDSEYREQLGESARKFVENNWKPVMLAGKILKIINDIVPDSWFFDPYQLTYLHGACVEEERLRIVLKKLIVEQGIGALALEDKPKLKNLFEKFIHKND
jgi:glycosyltransferase involved in cell wall biosynthesis